jgi:Plasmid stabilization system protein
LRVRFTPSARRQFLDAVGYIHRDNPDAARAFRRRVETKLRRLERFPQSGRPIPEFPDVPHREVIIAPFRFFYRPVAGVVWVVAVWHGAQLPGEPAA